MCALDFAATSGHEKWPRVAPAPEIPTSKRHMARTAPVLF
jgi:hypothetical protein